METIQFWLFLFGTYIIFRILHNAFTNFMLKRMRHIDTALQNNSFILIAGSFLLLAAFMMSIDIYNILFSW